MNLTTDVEAYKREKGGDRERGTEREEERIYDPHHSTAVYLFWILDKYLRS